MTFANVSTAVSDETPSFFLWKLTKSCATLPSTQWFNKGQASLSRKRNYKLHNMKRLLALIFVAGFAGCAQQPPPPAVTTGYPYSRYATTAEVWGYRSGMYANWTTAQLQQRRLDLYGMTPLAQSRQGVPAYIYHGQALPQQDEIKAIEVELNQRYQAGDKSADLIEFWPESRRHIAGFRRVENF
jgi:hypothetical protein